MAGYRFSAKVVGRSSGRSATAAAAYRASDRIHDARTGDTHDYSRKGGTLHAEIMAPDNAPDWMRDRNQLWNAVEKVEKRKDAQLAREIQLSLPHELDHDKRVELVRGFVAAEFVERGMVADIAIHAPNADGDERNHHAHIMLTMRSLTGDGFGNKNREWNAKPVVERWREEWATHQNRMLAREGEKGRVDHRSFAAQGIDREPQQHMGSAAAAMNRKGKPTRIGSENHAVQQRNAERASLHSQRAQNAAWIATEREKQGRTPDEAKAQRDDKINRAEAATRGAQRQRHERERAAVVARQTAENAATKATVRAELSAITERLDSAKGVKAIVRNVFGRTKQDNAAKERLGGSLGAIERAEARELARLDAQHRHERAERKARADDLREKAAAIRDRSKVRLEQVRERKAKQRAKPPRPQEPANDTTRSSVDQAQGQPRRSTPPRAPTADPTAENTRQRREKGIRDADTATTAPTTAQTPAKRSDGTLRGEWGRSSTRESTNEPEKPRERGEWSRSHRGDDGGRKPS